MYSLSLMELTLWRLLSIFSLLNTVQFSCSVVSNSLRSHGLQHARPPCPSPTPGVYSNSCPLSQWCHPTISSSVIPFSSCLQSLPASRSFQMSQFFASGGQCNADNVLRENCIRNKWNLRHLNSHFLSKNIISNFSLFQTQRNFLITKLMPLRMSSKPEKESIWKNCISDKNDISIFRMQLAQEEGSLCDHM